jgi:hypothetical protein|uniref:hypothetical protein n=1 Tax=Terrimesophilobacter sp. TaxID=2906435 RepID=UPI002F92E939
MHVEAALRAVEGEILKLAFEIGLHLEQLQPEHLGVRDEWIGPAVPDLDRFVDEVVRLRRLLCDGVDGMLQDLPLRPRHNRRLDRLADLLEAC